ncbi:hypothetical protein BZM27_36990 [Paraburkholderia steynii]|uniref:Uncharacterized protein n=1 Tax=Paraburkholderia steynii TaxID=1245441 RepID=A0A4R0XFX4_9BURK|nr:hypothetical protein BZM27_36990 [Paraburkholderia steynii]
MRTVYLAWFLQQDSYGNEPVGRFKVSEYATEAALERAHAANGWVLAADAVPVFESLLTLHEAQPATVPRHKIVSANDPDEMS